VARQTIVLSHGTDDEKIRELENNPNIIIHERRTDGYDTVHQLPLHIDPNFKYMRYRTTYVYEVIPEKKSPSQHPKKRGSVPVSRAKTLGDTDEFISAFWINGKPKCREGYRYDFISKMCRLIK